MQQPGRSEAKPPRDSRRRRYDVGMPSPTADAIAYAESLEVSYARSYVAELDGPFRLPPVRVRAVHYPATRASAKRRFLLLHGNPSHLHHFSANLAFLREHGDVALFDAPGFGRSPAVKEPISLHFMAEVARAFAASLGWHEGVDVIGQSHGGAVAQTLAARWPELVRSGILLCTMGYPATLALRLGMLPGAETVTHAVASRATRFPFRALATAFARAETRASFAPDAIPEGLCEGELLLVAARPEIQRSSIRAIHGDPTRILREQAPRIRAPLLFVHGAGDRLVPIAFAERLFAMIAPGSPRSRFVRVEGGHMVHLTHPARVHAELERWLAEDRPASV